MVVPVIACPNCSASVTRSVFLEFAHQRPAAPRGSLRELPQTFPRGLPPPNLTFQSYSGTHLPMKALHSFGRHERVSEPPEKRFRIRSYPEPEIIMAIAILRLQQDASTGDRAGRPVPGEGTRLVRIKRLVPSGCGQNASSRRSLGYSRTSSAPRTEEPCAARNLTHNTAHFRFWDSF